VRVIGNYVRTTVPDEIREEFIGSCNRSAEASRREEGCVAYFYAEDIAEPGVFYTVELWQTQADLDRHKTAEHYHARRAEMAAMRVKPDWARVAQIDSLNDLVSPARPA
jgi:quinol monooxygenase YgiN